ncbi:MAG: WYL domain-containing protein [Gemmatimonadetes bacterium]|nr:MAG: WYL domain-containing protein [Gemmatimonadota bacterium]
MSGADTASARLERLLHVLPAASREGGASLAVLADELGTTPARILDDLTEVGERVYYHPGGWPDDIQILVEADRVQVVHAGGLDRPVKLSPRETLCLALALRGAAAASHLPPHDERNELLRRAEEHLAAFTESRLHEAFAAPDVADDPGQVRGELIAAARERRACAILYVKAGARDAEARVIHPYTVVYAQGAWYAVGWCRVSEGVRVFRDDRVVEACRTDETFETPDDFRVEDYVADGAVYRAPDEERVRVRYSARIARWIREHARYRGWEICELEDGDVVAEHTVADPGWVVAHTLTYGAEAEVIAPASYRRLVREAVRGLAG